jgi:succinoglycan biosynthesis transport protein ExoP
MPTMSPLLEALPNPSDQQGVKALPHPGLSKARPRRLIIFISVFLSCLLVGLIFVFARDPVYQSSASLLTVAPTPVDRENAEANVQHATIQRQILVGQPLLVEVLSRLNAEGELSEPLSVDDLHAMLSVTPVAETNVVELRARGANPTILPLLVNTWIDVYQETRAREIKQATGTTAGALQDEFQALSEKIERKRREVERFRDTYNILTRKDADNQALARLKGLNESLNKANEKEVTTRSRLEAIRQAIARGEPVVPPSDERSMANLERRAQELREELTQLNRRYTKGYIALQPQLKLIPEQLKKIEEEIAQKHLYGKQAAVNEAAQIHAAAKESVQEIQRQINAHKREASEFTARFAEYEAMQKELQQLEDLYRKTQQRLVKIEVKQQEKYPQIDVVERAYKPNRPISPNYARDSGIALAVSFIVALLGVWLYDYLTRKEKQAQAALTLSGIHVYPSAGAKPDAGLLDHTLVQSVLPQAKTNAVLEKPTTAAPGGPLRELSEPEVNDLLDAAEIRAQQLIMALLSGLTLEEAVALRPEHIDLDQQTIRVPDGNARTLPLADALKASLARSDNQPAWLSDSPVTVEDLSALVTCAAIDAGLQNAGDIDADILRHTYILYLVRQGLRLSQLQRVIGPVAAKTLAAYARYSPAGPGLLLEAINPIYPPLSGKRTGP